MWQTTWPRWVVTRLLLSVFQVVSKGSKVRHTPPHHPQNQQSQRTNQIAHQGATVAGLLSATLQSLDTADPPPSILPLVEAVLLFEYEKADARSLVESERAATVAVRQLRQDLRDEKVAHDALVRGDAGERGDTCFLQTHYKIA